jgi:hypothetical protein
VVKVRGRLAIFDGTLLAACSSVRPLDLQLGDRPLVRVLATLPSYEGTWYVSIAADDEFAGGIAR